MKEKIKICKILSLKMYFYILTELQIIHRTKNSRLKNLIATLSKFINIIIIWAYALCLTLGKLRGPLDGIVRVELARP